MKTNPVIETIQTRRSVRSYSSKQIDKEDLTTILHAATHAPTGMGLQTWHFIAVQKADKLKELNNRVKNAFTRAYKQWEDEDYCCYYHAPTLIIVSNEPKELWAGQDCAAALQNIFLAARSLGIDSCWINQPALACDDPEVRTFLTTLGVSADHKVYGCAALGYSDGTPLSEKKLKEGTITIV
ncbi:Coenzyme F420:L-glutamate ligase [termite gut metagenome]|uniref:Coenzyme F420:L-glutamate ligase n=1 Tax=termite gut metagenome TaxID=433724 RepID=A0A5J4SRA1_9ZZZZ